MRHALHIMRHVLHIVRHVLHITRHALHITRHALHITRHALHIVRHAQHIARHALHIARHAVHITRHAVHITRHAVYITRHAVHITRHALHITRHALHITRHALHITRHVLHIKINWNYFYLQSVDKHPLSKQCPAVQFKLRTSIKEKGPNLWNNEIHCPVVLTDLTFGWIGVILTFRHRASCIQDRRLATPQRTLFPYSINKYILLSDICLTLHHRYKEYRQPTSCNNNVLLIIPVTSTCFGQLFTHLQEHQTVCYSLWYNVPTMLPAGNIVGALYHKL